MLQSLLSRSRTVKFVIVLFLCVLLSSLLFVSDTILSKIHARQIPTSCVLCALSEPVSFTNSTKVVRFSVYPYKHSRNQVIDVVVFFSHVNRNSNLKSKFLLCLTSLFKYATTPLHLHILTDDSSLSSAVEILQKTVPSANASIQISLYDVNELLEPLKELIDLVRPYFSFKQGAYYSDGLFYISIGLYKVMPLQKVIVVDADVKFLDDIKYLHYQFEKFSSEAIIGIAQEQQPVYRHVLHEYRRLNNNSKFGGSPPDGMPGFNSGVLLIDLGKMKISKLYISLLNNSTLQKLITKYKFKGHLGDQDFYTLVSFEHPNLFYTLPCTWNRQLCQWWKHHGYADVFDSYHLCNGTINLLHGNCNSLIPDDLDIYAL